MQLQESGEMYLETIYVLSQSSSCVRAIDVGEYMGFSKPSVSRAMSILKQGGFVVSGTDGCLTLTDAGRKHAEKIYKRHTVLSEMLIKLGVSEETASKDACRIEHVISDETFEAIQKYLQE